MFERIPTLPVSSQPYAPQFVVERSDGPGEQFWDFRFTVMGKGMFPYDMLRSDQCWPADTQSAMTIPTPDTAEERREPREVVLTSRQIRKHWLPEFGRWASFGWFVKSTAWDL
jgi:hypothetical protein